MTRRGQILLLVVIAAFVGGHADAIADSKATFRKAARAIADWQYQEADKLIKELISNDEEAPETKYLLAELAFHRGKYADAVNILGSIGSKGLGRRIKELGELATSSHEVTKDFVSMRSQQGHFEIVYAKDKDEVIAQLAAQTLEAAYERLGADFDHRPVDLIRVELLGSPKDLAKLSSLTETDIETTSTIALCKYGKLMVVSPRATVFGYPWMDTLVHEYVHYIVSQKSRDRIPVWLHEGLARFSQNRWRSAPDAELNSRDKELLGEGLKRNKLVSFDDMHPSMAKLPSQEASTLAFAEVNTMISYVHSQVGYAGIQSIIDHARRGQDAREAVATVMAKPWSKVESKWKLFLRKSDILKGDRGLARKSGKIHFRKGDSKGDDNVGLEEVKSKKAEKFARLAGMLRARKRPKAAAVEYEKALKEAPGDRFILSRLSRTYLQLKEYGKAIEMAEPLFGRDPGDASPATTLGVAFAASGQHDRAKLAFERALQVNPFDPSIRCGLAEVYSSLKEGSLAKREQQACNTLR